AVLFRPGGAVAAEAGTGSPSALWERIAAGRGGPESFGLDGTRVFASPILVDGEIRFWLALSSQGVTPALTEEVVEVAERLLRLIELARDVGVMEERVRRGELLSELLDGRRAREVSPERLELFGFCGKPPWRVALVSVGPAAEQAVRLLGN